MIETKFMMRALIDFFGFSPEVATFILSMLPLLKRCLWRLGGRFSFEWFGSYGDSDGGQYGADFFNFGFS